MNTTQQGIILLLKSAITGEGEALPDGFDLEQALPVLAHHNIIPLGFVGAAQSGISTKTPLMQQMLLQYQKAAIVSARQLKRVQTLCDTFEKNGIDYMPVKGCNMKLLYPTPELRPMGDADILIRLEQYPLIRPLMLALGYEESKETDHELIWLSKGLMVELHKRLIPSYNKDYYRYYGDGWRLASIQNGHRYDMRPEDELIYLFTHFAKHYRAAGIGLVHLLDLWVYRRCHPQLDEAYIECTLLKMQLNEFYHNILRLLEVWFNGSEWDEKTAFISDFIFNSGSWGSMMSSRLSSIVQYRQSVHSVSSGFRVIIRKLFPSRRSMKQQYPLLNRRPYLLPWFWFRQIWERIIRKKAGLQYLSAVSSDKVDEYEQALTYVGLGFHFEE